MKTFYYTSIAIIAGLLFSSYVFQTQTEKQDKKLLSDFRYKNLPASEVVQKINNISMLMKTMSFLILASAKGNKVMCEMLIDKGAVLDWQAKDGMNAVVAAAMQQHPIVVRLLL